MNRGDTSSYATEGLEHGFRVECATTGSEGYGSSSREGYCFDFDWQSLKSSVWLMRWKTRQPRHSHDIGRFEDQGLTIQTCEIEVVHVVCTDPQCSAFKKRES